MMLRQNNNSLLHDNKKANIIIIRNIFAHSWIIHSHLTTTMIYDDNKETCECDMFSLLFSSYRTKWNGWNFGGDKCLCLPIYLCCYVYKELFFCVCIFDISLLAIFFFFLFTFFYYNNNNNNSTLAFCLFSFLFFSFLFVKLKEGNKEAISFFFSLSHIYE